MPEAFYRTGQVAKALGTSSHHIRRLCETNQIQAEVTEGQQWKIPLAELQRLQKTGVPPIPERLEPPHNGRGLPVTTSPTPELVAAPSSDVVAAHEAADIAAQQVQIRKSKIEGLKLHKEATELGDFFRARRLEREQAAAAEQEAELERAEAERQQKAREKAERERESRLDGWVRYAFRCLPSDTPAGIRLEVHQAVSARLLQLRPIPARDVTGKLVDALVERTLAPWRRRKEIESILVQARDWWLPSAARAIEGLSTWQVKAVRAAADAIDKLRNDAGIEEIKAVASRAVAAVSQEFEHSEQCGRLVKHLWLELQDATDDELLAAQKEVEKALDALPASASEQDRQSARDTGIKPARERIAARLAERARTRAEQARRFQADLKLTNLHSLIFDHIGHLGKPDELEFTGFEDQWGTTGKLEEKIRPALFQELLGDLNLSDAQIQKRIEALVGEHLGEVLAPPRKFQPVLIQRQRT